MIIESEVQIKIDEVCRWLNDYDSSLKDNKHPFKETDAARMAREFCHGLLESSNADGMCGCPLCQG